MKHRNNWLPLGLLKNPKTYWSWHWRKRWRLCQFPGFARITNFNNIIFVKILIVLPNSHHPNAPWPHHFCEICFPNTSSSCFLVKMEIRLWTHRKGKRVFGRRSHWGSGPISHWHSNKKYVIFLIKKPLITPFFKVGALNPKLPSFLWM